MFVVTGDEIGLVKATTLKDNKVEILARSHHSTGISHLVWAGKADNIESQIGIARKDGSLECIDSKTHATLGTLQTQSTDIVGFDVLRSSNGISWFCCRGMGDVYVRPIEAEKGGEVSARFNIGKDIRCVRIDPHSPVNFAAAGKESLLRIWDLNGEVVFKSRNVPHDFLDLRVPYWVTDLSYLPSENNKILTSTAYHQLRLYDTKAGDRPVMDVTISDHALVSLCMSPDSRYAVVGDGAGRMQKFDLRMRKVVGGFHGIAGSIRSIQYHPTLPFVAACGLDRYLRIYHSETRKVVNKVYLKQRLSCLLFSATLPMPEAGVEEKEAAAEEDEEMWQELDAKAGTSVAVRRKPSQDLSEDSDGDDVKGIDMSMSESEGDSAEEQKPTAAQKKQVALSKRKSSTSLGESASDVESEDERPRSRKAKQARTITHATTTPSRSNSGPNRRSPVATRSTTKPKAHPAHARLRR